MTYWPVLFTVFASQSVTVTETFDGILGESAR
jgi:hypothetical protein